MNIPKGSVLIPGSQLRKFARYIYKTYRNDSIKLSHLYKDLKNKVEKLISNHDNNRDINP